ncbi:MAG: hypothetical protein IJS39_17340 [Synergistaceae bacterium]|nr:hypothetical protein [Synergistaceae bacterium]
MRKIAVIVLLSLVFVSITETLSFAMIGGEPSGAVGTVETWRMLPDGTQVRTKEITVKPSTSGAKTGATAGAVGGATAGAVIAGPVGAAVGAGVGAVVGAIGGWIFGPAD